MDFECPQVPASFLLDESLPLIYDIQLLWDFGVFSRTQTFGNNSIQGWIVKRACDLATREPNLQENSRIAKTRFATPL